MKTKIGAEFWIDYALSLKGHPKYIGKHGHTARVLVEVEGTVKGGQRYQDNVIMDFADLKKEVKKVLDKLDNKDLDEIFEFPTAENIAQWIFDRLKDKIPLSKVTIFAGKGKWCSIEK